MQALYEFLRKLRNSKVILFGTGNASLIISRNFPVNISYCVDNDQKRWGDSFLGKEIYSPSALASEYKESVVVVVASMYYTEVIHDNEKANDIINKASKEPLVMA